MKRRIGRRIVKDRHSPGTLIHGENNTTETRITCMDYDLENVYESTIVDIDEKISLITENQIRWINVCGLSDERKIIQLCEMFNIHHLNIEDILNTNERPKLHENEEYIFITVDRQIYNVNKVDFSKEQVSLILGKNFIISFNEGENDTFEPVRMRIRGHQGKSRKSGADYLLYLLLDVIIDEYFVFIEQIEEQFENLEDELLLNPNPASLQKIQSFKRKMLYIYRSTWPLREVISSLYRLESPLLDKSVSIFLHDLYDHIIQVIDTIEFLRDLISSLLDIYLSSVSNRLNVIMKVLTIISTIFMPLSFVTGFYGMNFKHMPELNYHWSYPAVIGVIICIVIGMLFFFRRKKWI